jgi:hypothetical protein
VSEDDEGKKEGSGKIICSLNESGFKTSLMEKNFEKSTYK